MLTISCLFCNNLTRVQFRVVTGKQNAFCYSQVTNALFQVLAKEHRTSRQSLNSQQQLRQLRAQLRDQVRFPVTQKRNKRLGHCIPVPASDVIQTRDIRAFTFLDFALATTHFCQSVPQSAGIQFFRFIRRPNLVGWYFRVDQVRICSIALQNSN